MKQKEFIHAIDDARISAAIGEAEKKTTGEIRAFVARHASKDPVADAEKHFAALGLTKTRDRNAILIYIAPKSQNFAIFGDVAIHQKCGAPFWTALRDEMVARLKEHQYTDALIHVITRAGALLAEHFPANPNANPDEHPNTVMRG